MQLSSALRVGSDLSVAKSISNYVAYLLDGRTLQRSNGAGAGGVPWPIHYTHRQRSVINIPIIVYSASHQMATNENLLMCPHRKRYAATHTHTHTHNTTQHHTAQHTLPLDIFGTSVVIEEALFILRFLATKRRRRCVAINIHEALKGFSSGS